LRDGRAFFNHSLFIFLPGVREPCEGAELHRLGGAQGAASGVQEELTGPQLRERLRLANRAQPRRLLAEDAKYEPKTEIEQRPNKATQPSVSDPQQLAPLRSLKHPPTRPSVAAARAAPTRRAQPRSRRRRPCPPRGRPRQAGIRGREGYGSGCWVRRGEFSRVRGRTARV
jgi:hypothetical protein